MRSSNIYSDSGRTLIRTGRTNQCASTALISSILKGVSVPNILVFDQPSQVYFPQKSIRDGSTAEEDAILIQDEDKSAVKKIFKALSGYIKKSKSELQIIIMEHADEDIWGEFDDITLVER